MTSKKKTLAEKKWPNNIGLLSKERDWSQADLARKTGYTPQEITRWWNGTRELHQSHIVRFAKIFQCPWGDILSPLPEAREERFILEKYRGFDDVTKVKFQGMAEALDSINHYSPKVVTLDTADFPAAVADKMIEYINIAFKKIGARIEVIEGKISPSSDTDKAV